MSIQARNFVHSSKEFCPLPNLEHLISSDFFDIKILYKSYKTFKTYNGELSHLTGATISPILTETEPRKKELTQKRDFSFHGQTIDTG